MRLMSGDIDRIKGPVYTTQKQLYNIDNDTRHSLAQVRPEEEGVSSSLLADFYKETSRTCGIDAHSILIMRNGRILCCGSFAPYRGSLWHITHSMCKSLTGLAVGLLIEDGILSLDEKIIDIWKDKTNFLSAIRLKDITVRHLLTMSSGITVNEAGAVTENDWLRAIMESGTSFEPGTKFMYNSMNSYLLSAIIKQKTGNNVSVLLKKRIFEPMRIDDFYWEQCPKGIEKGGWGLYLLIEDMAKIGQLYLQMGEWDHRQLVSREWIIESTKNQIDTNPEKKEIGYGYQIWVNEAMGCYQFNGMLGQNVIMFPKKQMVVATTGGSSSLSAEKDISQLIYKYFGSEEFQPSQPLPKDDKAFYALENVVRHLNYHVPYQEPVLHFYSHGGWKHAKRKRTDKKPKKNNNSFLKHLNSYCYQMENSRAGILPLFIQCMHGNYSRGVEEIAFYQENDTFYVGLKENGILYKLPVGFDKASEMILEINEESYWIAVLGELTENEDGIKVLKLQLSFLETSNTRIIKLYFYKNQMQIKAIFDELPSLTDLMDGLTFVLNKSPGESLKGFTGDLAYTEYRLYQLMVPTVIGTKKEKKQDIELEARET